MLALSPYRIDLPDNVCLSHGQEPVLFNNCYGKLEEYRVAQAEVVLQFGLHSVQIFHYLMTSTSEAPATLLHHRAHCAPVLLSEVLMLTGLLQQSRQCMAESVLPVPLQPPSPKPV